MKPLIIGSGKECPRCGKPMQRCSHRLKWEPKPEQQYWFTYWDRCFKCCYMQHYEEAKVHNLGGSE